jgi:hypothetical protein
MPQKKQFIPEPVYDEFAETLTSFLLKDIVSHNSKRRVLTVEYSTPLEFTLIFSQVRVSKFFPSKLLAFKQMPWESISFNNHGFAIDSNAFLPSVSDLLYPEIEISLCLSLDSTKINYNELKFRLLDNIRHEFEHLLQKGINAIESHEVNTPISVRRSSENNFRYFILSSEIPAMVAGLNLASQKRGTSLEEESYRYLMPFVDYKMITKAEADHIIKVWLKFSTASS